MKYGDNLDWLRKLNAFIAYNLLFLIIMHIFLHTYYNSYTHTTEDINGMQQHKHGEEKVINKRVGQDKLHKLPQPIK